MELRERRVRPIYEAFDAHNFKQAYKLATAGVTRDPSDALVKALKAYAALKIDKRDEALSLCQELKALRPSDADVLSLLTLVLGALGRSTCCFGQSGFGRRKVSARRVANFDALIRVDAPHVVSEASGLYEAAVEKLPNDEPLTLNWFFALFSEGAYSKAQTVRPRARATAVCIARTHPLRTTTMLMVCEQVAMRLFKNFGKPSYTFWIVTCLVTQVQQSGAAPALLTLAARLMQKHADDGHITHYERMYPSPPRRASIEGWMQGLTRRMCARVFVCVCVGRHAQIWRCSCRCMS